MPFIIGASASSAKSADQFRRLVLGVVVLLSLNSPARGQAEVPIIRVGSKSFTESVILGEMLRQLAEHAGARAEHQAELGGTQIAFAALLKGDIDAYCEYTGTLSLEVLEA